MSTPMQILVAHARASTRSYITEALKDEGYEVVQVSDGVDLVDELQGNEDAFSLVISAVELPECSGLDVLEEIREQGDDTPFLLLSWSDSDPTNQAEALDASVLDYPFDIDELVATVHALLEDSHSAAA